MPGPPTKRDEMKKATLIIISIALIAMWISTPEFHYFETDEFNVIEIGFPNDTKVNQIVEWFTTDSSITEITMSLLDAVKWKYVLYGIGAALIMVAILRCKNREEYWNDEIPLMLLVPAAIPIGIAMLMTALDMGWLTDHGGLGKTFLLMGITMTGGLLAAGGGLFILWVLFSYLGEHLREFCIRIGLINPNDYY